jgi:rhodanese-related sulfurtransferase
MRVRIFSPLALSAVFFLLLSFSPGAFASDPAVTPDAAKAMIEEKSDLILLDVRNPDEYAGAHFPDALNIPVKELETRYTEVPSGKPVLIYCARGRRAETAYRLLKEKRPDIVDLLFLKGEPIFPPLEDKNP